MNDTTDTLARPGFPPPAPSSVAFAAPPAWPGQISQAGPALPSVAPAVQRPAAPDTSHLTATMFGALAPESTNQPPRRKNRPRRVVKWMFLLAALGGIGYAGVTYGPDLVENVTGADADNGPVAPLAYPVPTAPPAVMRTTTFTVSEFDSFGGTQTYEVTADFESGITRVVIPRADTPDLEILTLWEQSFVRRVDEATWYALPRGDFPVDFSMGRSRWVRTLDELLPPELRQFFTIDEANESTVDNAPARRLVVSADPVRLLPTPTAIDPTPAVDPTPIAVDPTPAADPTLAADPTPAADPTLAAPPAPALDVPPPPAVAPAPALPPGISLQPGTDGTTRLSMEIWVDATGLVRKSVMPAELGGETITVTAVSPDAFQPIFPTPEAIQPLTAQVLFHLGL